MPIGAQSMYTSSYQPERSLKRCLAFQAMGFMYTIQQEQAEALAKKLAIEKAEKEKMLTDIYNQREHSWQQAQEQANRTCASGYDEAARYLHQLFEAYQFKADNVAFEQRFKRFVERSRFAAGTR